MIRTALFILTIFWVHTTAASQTAKCEFHYQKLFTKLYTTATDVPTPENGVFEIMNNVTQYYVVDSKSTQSSFNLELLINKKGNLKSVGIYNKTKKMLTKEELLMIEIVKKTENWIPAKCDGKNVNFLLLFPIRIHLQ